MNLNLFWKQEHSPHYIFITDIPIAVEDSDSQVAASTSAIESIPTSASVNAGTCDDSMITSTSENAQPVTSTSNINITDSLASFVRGTKRRWTSEEVDIFHKKFRFHILNKTMASRTELEAVQTELTDRTTAQIRVRLNNIILGKQKITGLFDAWTFASMYKL